MQRFKAYPRLNSVKVIVEERRVDLEVHPGNWRTHEYKGFEGLPQRLLPAFASPGTRADLDLLALVDQACASGNVESRYEFPYADGTGSDKKTVLRTVTVHLYYRKEARAMAAGTRSIPVVTLPLGGDQLWSRFEIQQLERELAPRYPALSASVIALAVRLAKLDVRPSAGRNNLARETERLLQSWPTNSVN